MTGSCHPDPAGADGSPLLGPDLARPVPEPAPMLRGPATPPSGRAAETAPRAAKLPTGRGRQRQRPPAALGSDARDLAGGIASPAIREDLTGERPTVAISSDVEYWAHLERMALIPYEGRTMLLGAVRELVWTVAALILLMAGLLLVGLRQTSAFDVHEVLGGAGLLGVGFGVTGGVRLARRRGRPSPTRRR